MSDLLPKSLVDRLALLIGFGLALLGLANVLPAFWILPRIGPFEIEPFRAGVFAIALLATVVFASFGRQWMAVSPARSAVGFVLDAILLGAGLFACWRYYGDGQVMASSIMFFAPMHAWTALSVCVVIVVLCWRIWGAPLAIFALVTLIYFYTGPYWPWIFETGPVNFIQGTAENLWFNHDDGVLGNLFSIIVSTVFPFIILGAMLEGTGAGQSMIRISFAAMRRFRGGPAHAAILASGLFGTVSGSVIANVVGTGVVTIPMIKKRGFAPAFAGGIEATASTGGQVMPPIMGATALVMADYVGISYLTIIIAAVTPALAYYASLFAMVVFESRRLGVEAAPESEDGIVVEPQDYINLLLVFIPLAVVIYALVRGASAAGSALMALLVLILLSFLNPTVRRQPQRLLLALAQGGFTFAKLVMAVGAVGIIVAVMSSTGLPTDFAIVIGQGDHTLLVTLIITALACLVLGMGMPTLPSYIATVVMLGPAMQRLGLEPLTAHMFVFYFAVAAAITPPTALPAYAAAAIAGARPMETAVSAMRLGIVIFAVPFAFTYNPIMLVVAESGVTFNWTDYAFLCARLVIAIYLLATVFTLFDTRRLTVVEALLRAAIAVALLSGAPVFQWGGLVAAAVAVAVHLFKGRVSEERIA